MGEKGISIVICFDFVVVVGVEMYVIVFVCGFAVDFKS